MKSSQFLLMLSVFMTLSCRAAFTNLDGDRDSSTGSADAGGQESPFNGENPNQGPPGTQDPTELVIEEIFGPGEDALCPQGGKRVLVGIDDNNDGQLSEDEMKSIDYVCPEVPVDEPCIDQPGKGGKDDPAQDGKDNPGQNGDGCQMK